MLLWGLLFRCPCHSEISHHAFLYQLSSYNFYLDHLGHYSKVNQTFNNFLRKIQRYNSFWCISENVFILYPVIFKLWNLKLKINLEFYFSLKFTGLLFLCIEVMCSFTGASPTTNQYCPQTNMTFSPFLTTILIISSVTGEVMGTTSPFMLEFFSLFLLWKSCNDNHNFSEVCVLQSCDVQRLALYPLLWLLCWKRFYPFMWAAFSLHW